MSAFEAFSGDLEAEPLQGSGLSCARSLLVRFDFRLCLFESSEREISKLSKGRGWSSQKILTKMSAFEAFSSNLEAEPLRGVGGRAPGKF